LSTFENIQRRKPLGKLGSNGPRRALRPDAQPFDEVRITTVPRYKTSGLSGDEWRISAKISFYRKSHVVHEKIVSTVEHACGFLMAEFYNACDAGHGYYAGEEELCDQEGCSERATVTYRVKKEFSRSRPHEWNVEYDEIVIRKFCQRHSKRGDCAFDDADANYELISGQQKEPVQNDVSESIFGGVVSMEESDGENETPSGGTPTGN
jgi:hypothetical protein